MRCTFVQQKLYPQPASADEVPQNCVAERELLEGAKRSVYPKVRAVVAERHLALTPHVGGQDQYMVVFREGCSRVVDEPITIEIGNHCGMQAVHGDELAERWNTEHQGPEQLPQSVGLY